MTYVAIAIGGRCTAVSLQKSVKKEEHVPTRIFNIIIIVSVP